MASVLLNGKFHITPSEDENIQPLQNVPAVGLFLCRIVCSHLSVQESVYEVYTVCACECVGVCVSMRQVAKGN